MSAADTSATPRKSLLVSVRPTEVTAPPCLYQPGTLAHTRNPSTHETEAEGLPQV